MIDQGDSGLSSEESDLDELTLHLQNYLCVTVIEEAVFSLPGYHHICIDCVDSLTYGPLTKNDSLWYEDIPTVKESVIYFHAKIEKGMHIPYYYYCVCKKRMVNFSEAVDCRWCRSICKYDNVG